MQLVIPVNMLQNSVPLRMEVTEQIPVGIRIGEVAAVDQDEGANAEIDYAIIREWIFNFFFLARQKISGPTVSCVSQGPLSVATLRHSDY